MPPSSGITWRCQRSAFGRATIALRRAIGLHSWARTRASTNAATPAMSTAVIVGPSPTAGVRAPHSNELVAAVLRSLAPAHSQRLMIRRSSRLGEQAAIEMVDVADSRVAIRRGEWRARAPPRPAAPPSHGPPADPRSPRAIAAASPGSTTMPVRPESDHVGTPPTRPPRPAGPRPSPRSARPASLRSSRSARRRRDRRRCVEIAAPAQEVQRRGEPEPRRPWPRARRAARRRRRSGTAHPEPGAATSAAASKNSSCALIGTRRATMPIIGVSAGSPSSARSSPRWPRRG